MSNAEGTKFGGHVFTLACYLGGGGLSGALPPASVGNAVFVRKAID